MTGKFISRLILSRWYQLKREPRNTLIASNKMGVGSSKLANLLFLSSILAFPFGYFSILEDSKDCSKSITTETLEKNTEFNRLTSPHSAPSQSHSTVSKNVKVKNYEYVIIGTGTAAQAACELLKQTDPLAKLLIITEYAQLPHPDILGDDISISKELEGVYDRWRRQLSSHLHAMVTTDHRDLVETKTDVIVTRNFQGVRIDRESKIIHVPGTAVSYNKCLLAPPGKIRSHYMLDSSVQYALREFVNPLKTLQDFKVLQAFLNTQKSNNPGESEKKKVVVVGGGFFGVEIATAIAKFNKDFGHPVDLYQAYFEQHPLDAMVPKYFAKVVKKKLNENGIKQLPNMLITDVHSVIDKSKSQSIEAKFINFANEEASFPIDYMLLASTIIDPDVEIASRSGFEIDSNNGGVVVNESLEAFRDLFVAGTSASFYNESLGRRRVTVYDHAINSGLTCARNMMAAGYDESASTLDGKSDIHRVDTKLSAYKHQPAYMCNLSCIDMKLECVGDIDSNLKTIGFWLAKRDETTGQAADGSDFQRGIIYYLRNSKVVGILCCNASECIDSARNLLNESPTIKEDPSHLKRRIRLGPDYWIRVYES